MKNFEFTARIPARLARIVLRSKTAFRRANLTWLYAFLIIAARFCYVPFMIWPWPQGDYLGWSKLDSLLYTFGIESAFVLMAIVLRTATGFMEDEKAIRGYTMLSNAMAFVGFFFLCWVFLDTDRMNYIEEIVACFVAGALAVGVMVFFYRNYQPSVRKLRKNVRNLSDLILVKTLEHNLVNNLDEYGRKIVKPAIDELEESAEED